MKDREAIRETVRTAYGAIARSGGSCCGSGRGCGTVAPRLGYSPAELKELPAGADMGLSCGNPTALARLKPGEVVLDLGSGGGLDVFVAARKVGKRGRVIGVDMTPEMIARARRNAAVFRKRTGLDNVEFRLGEIEHLPVADATVDVVISNCVVNLSPDKPQVWREIARVLKPGGRVAVSDVALRKPLPAAVRKVVEALVGCVAGAVLVKDTRRMLRAAGFTGIRLRPNPDYIRAMTRSSHSFSRKIARHLPRGRTLADYITSLSIEARRG